MVTAVPPYNLRITDSHPSCETCDNFSYANGGAIRPLALAEREGADVDNALAHFDNLGEKIWAVKHRGENQRAVSRTGLRILENIKSR